ncbi:MAG: PIN domain-containing protein [Candidatus Woesearchaeota archaeon]|nr:PIN domain-containing protein [Candidatus Woesearchaeota archaeon]
MPRYYFDTAIWIDILNDRVGFQNEPLGEYGLKLAEQIISSGNKIVISDAVLDELLRYFSLEELNGLFRQFEKNMLKVFSTSKERREAALLASLKNVPSGDALHALLAKRTNSILISRDNHFCLLDYVSKHFKPEELLQ